MVHVNKKIKIDESETKLENLLFGENTEDLWTYTGNELEEEEEDLEEDLEDNTDAPDEQVILI